MVNIKTSMSGIRGCFRRGDWNDRIYPIH